MSTTDPIAHMLTKIRNAITAKKKEVEIPSSKLKLRMAEILKDEGYIKDTAARVQASRAMMYRRAATDASKGIDVKTRLDELEEVDKLTMRRWGPR